MDTLQCMVCGNEIPEDEVYEGICIPCAKDSFNIELGIQFYAAKINSFANGAYSSEEVLRWFVKAEPKLAHEDISQFCFSCVEDWCYFVGYVRRKGYKKSA